MSVTTLAYKNLVGGKLVDAAEGETMPILDPATGETIAEVARGTQADVSSGASRASPCHPR